MGKPIAQKAAATEEKEAPAPKTNAKGKASVSATTTLIKNSMTQVDVLAQLMVQIKKQSAKIEALKASF